MQLRYALNKNKYLLPEEIGHLERVLAEFSDTDSRNSLILLLSLRTGGRAKEILNLKKSDLNPYDESVLIRGIKGSNDREIPLHSPLFKKLAAYATTVPGDRLFPISYNRFRQIW